MDPGRKSFGRKCRYASIGLRIPPTCNFSALQPLRAIGSIRADENRILQTALQRRTQFYFPPENPSTPAKENLGKILFFDPRLSETNTMSCSTCHNPLLSFSDGLPRAIGAGGKILARRTPSLLNPFMLTLQWDSEFTFFEDQALNAIRKKTGIHKALELSQNEAGQVMRSSECVGVTASAWNSSRYKN
ncbi:MAG: cytochrome-c peroxidase [Oligoflexus sp.]|nr:cytochrome-c peroxidase [Oligoflexus sp.]